MDLLFTRKFGIWFHCRSVLTADAAASLSISFFNTEELKEAMRDCGLFSPALSLSSFLSLLILFSHSKTRDFAIDVHRMGFNIIVIVHTSFTIKVPSLPSQ